MFLLDANVFINASRQYYAPSIAPQFWHWLESQHTDGKLRSIRQVLEEIDDGKEGHLTKWASTLPDTFWMEPCPKVPHSMVEISNWVEDQSYRRAALDEFFKVADYYLVAQAHAQGLEIVTFEKPEPNSKKKVKIPDVCRAFEIPVRDPFDVYQALGLTFAK